MKGGKMITIGNYFCVWLLFLFICVIIRIFKEIDCGYSNTIYGIVKGNNEKHEVFFKLEPILIILIPQIMFLWYIFIFVYELIEILKENKGE
jgi:hypothetical protein